MSKSVDVIIPTLNRQQQIQNCLDSILSQSYLPVLIIVVDASDSDELGEIISQKYSHFSIGYIKSEIGLTRQRNVGIRHSKSDYILFLDDDIVLEPDFIEKAIQSLDKVPGYNVLTGKIINDNRKLEVNPLLVLFQRLFFMQESKDGRMKVSGDYNVKHPLLEGLFDVDIAIGGLTMYRNEIFKKYEFDTNYQLLEGYASLEDEDFSLQLKKTYNILYSTTARAYHYPQSAPQTRLSTFRRSRLRAFNYRYFYRKHRLAYGFRSLPHFISCIGFILEALINRRSLSGARGLIAGYYIFRKKTKNGEIVIPV